MGLRELMKKESMRLRIVLVVILFLGIHKIAYAEKNASVAQADAAAANARAKTAQQNAAAADARANIAEAGFAAANERANTAQKNAAAANERANIAEAGFAAVNERANTAQKNANTAQDSAKTVEEKLSKCKNEKADANTKWATDYAEVSTKLDELKDSYLWLQTVNYSLGFICACLIIALICVWSNSSTTEEADPDARELDDAYKKLMEEMESLKDKYEKLEIECDEIKNDHDAYKRLWFYQGVNIFCPVLNLLAKRNNNRLYDACVCIKSCIQFLLPGTWCVDIIFYNLLSGFFIAIFCVVCEICMKQTVTQAVMLTAINQTIDYTTCPWKLLVNMIMPTLCDMCEKTVG